MPAERLTWTTDIGRQLDSVYKIIPTAFSNQAVDISVAAVNDVYRSSRSPNGSIPSSLNRSSYMTIIYLWQQQNNGKIQPAAFVYTHNPVADRTIKLVDFSGAFINGIYSQGIRGDDSVITAVI